MSRLLLAVLVAAALVVDMGGAETAGTTYTGNLVVYDVDGRDGSDVRAVILNVMSTGEMFELRFMDAALESEAMAFPGSIVKVRGKASGDQLLVLDIEDATPNVASKTARRSLRSSAGAGFIPKFSANYTIKQLPAQRLVQDNVSTLVLVVDICDQPAVATAAAVDHVLFAGPNSKYSLEAYYAECSSGKARLNRDNSRVVGGIKIPCQGNAKNINFTASSCSWRDINGWMRYAEEQAVELYGVDLAAYKHHVLLMPDMYTYEAGCMWIGLGTLGPDRVTETGEYLAASAWLDGEKVRDHAAYLHEIGHTQYLHHATDARCSYCDETCVMGGCCSLRCFNAPHAWQLGWASPLAELKAESLPPNIFQRYAVPAQNVQPQNMIVVTPDWSPAFQTAYNAFFLQYRVKNGTYDTQVSDKNIDGLTLHTFDGRDQREARTTRFETTLKVGTEYRDKDFGSNLVVRLYSTIRSYATIGVCRWTEQTEDSCDDGQDNDCDGFIDYDDPDCKVKISPPPPSPPSTPGTPPANPANAVDPPADSPPPPATPASPLLIETAQLTPAQRRRAKKLEAKKARRRFKVSAAAPPPPQEPVA